jgi:hypothetical protein
MMEATCSSETSALIFNALHGVIRPKKTWKRSVVEEAQREGRTWREVKWLAKDRSRWRSFVKALCSYTGDNRN